MSKNNKTYTKALFIFRRDLRLIDNTGLHQAIDASEVVVPVFFLDPRQAKQHDYFTHAGFACMLQSLFELDLALRSQKGKLSIVDEKPEEVLAHIIKTNAIDVVYINRDYTPFARMRDAAIQDICTQCNVDFVISSDALLVEPEHITTDTGNPYTIYTPFYKKAAATIAVPKPMKQPITIWKPLKKTKLVSIHKKDIATYKKPQQICIGGRQEGERLLKNLATKKEYTSTRDIPHKSATSYLSVHHKFGTVSIRETYHRAQEVFGDDIQFTKELFWRDFFTHIAWHFPQVFKDPFQEKYASLTWSKSQKYFDAWKQGKTGFPIVDAGMRELVQTGYMHNRVRMITASFLVKDLHINWQWGERFFAQHLADYDPAVNNGNWQWAASTGCDAQPYFRIFNPWLQQKRFDPEATYIQTWIPELRHYSPKDIHDRYKNTALPDYPQPIVDHTKAAKAAKLLFKKVN